jgi:hypothetical protein
MKTGSDMTCSGNVGISYHINKADLYLNTMLKIRQQSIEKLQYHMHQPTHDDEDKCLSLSIN